MLIDEIKRLKSQRNALILAHYYAPLEVQDAADQVCDSFAMAKIAAKATEDVIVICGVRFMGESAKILCPMKTVLLPAPEAGCPMADMVTPEQVLELRRQYPKAAVMCYVNSSAAVKAVSHVCCTSSSALRIARALPEREIIFVPDRHLGSFVAKNVPEKVFHLHSGYCPAHNSVTLEDVKKAKEAHPGALFAVHPECGQDVVAQADFVGSTAEILDFARDAQGSQIIIGTEAEIVRRLRRDIPEKEFWPVKDPFSCGDMKRVTLEALAACLKDMSGAVELPPQVIADARSSLDRMVNM